MLLLDENVGGVKEEEEEWYVELRDAGSTTQRNSEECCFPHLPCPGPGLLASAGWRVETQRCATISARAYLCDQHRTKQLAAESNNMSLACLVTLSDTDTGDRNKRCGDHHTHRMFLIGRVNAAHYTVG